MENNTEREKWIDEVLDSTCGITRAHPAEGLHARVKDRLKGPQTRAKRPAVIRWAAAAVLLLAVNISSLAYSTLTGHAASRAENPLASEIQSVTTYNY